MSLLVHARDRAGGFEYVIVGRGTGCVSFGEERLLADSFRSLLAASERDQLRANVAIVQSAWYLPRVAWVDNPLDVGGACVSYLRRHPQLELAHVVAPGTGLIRLVVDFVARAMPSLNIRLVDNPDDVTQVMRVLEPELPMLWYDMTLYPPPGERFSSSVMRASSRPPPGAWPPPPPSPSSRPSVPPPPRIRRD